MLELQTERILSIVNAQLPDGEHHTVGQILSIPLPESVASWIHSEIRERLSDDVVASPHLSRATQTSSVAWRHTYSFLSTVIPMYRMDHVEARVLLREAVTIVGRYLVRPRQTLEETLFRNAELVSSDMIVRRLSTFTVYPYLPTLLRRFVTKERLDRREVHALIARVDVEVIRHHTAEDYVRLIDPLFDWCALGGSAEKTIPTEALSAFFDDKGFPGFRSYFTSIAVTRHRPELHLEEILVALRTLLESGPPSMDETVQASPDQKPHPPSRATEPAPSGFSDSIRRNIALSLTSAGIAEAPKRPPTGIAERFVMEQRNRFITVLFLGNEDHFAQFLQTLDEAHSWQEAARHLTDLLEQNALNPYAPEVVEFTEIVRRRFVQDEESTHL